MLLRRISQHVRDQNWFAVALDFIIVVFGVFIGIQVSNWNDERVLVQTEQKYIERLREDLASNHDDVIQRIAYFTQVRNHGIHALTALEKPRETLGEAFLIDIYQASQIVPRKFGTDTYDEILSVGANEAISDVAVRKRLANFYGSIQAQLSTLERTTPYRDEVRRHLPYAANRAIRSACDDIVETSAEGKPTISLPTQCEPGLPETEISKGVSAIFARNLGADLTERISDLDGKLIGLKIILDRIAQLDEFLEGVQ